MYIWLCLRIWLLQVCYSIWTDFWICSPCWNPVSRLRHDNWSCNYWTSFDNTLVMDDAASSRDSWGTLWLSFSMEPLKFLAFIWRVSNIFFLFLDKFHFFFSFSMASWKNLLFFICSADFHDYHHRLLYTKSGNYSSTFVYMDWWDFFN